MTPSASAATKTAAIGAMGLLLEMELPMVVRFGSTRMPLRDLLELSTGSVIDFDRPDEESVELLVNGRIVARGAAVTVHGHYGLRICEIVSVKDEAMLVPEPAQAGHAGKRE